jgi:hypothetical protein
MGDGFRGVSSDQDGRFKSAEKKLFAKMKFPPQFATKVDMRKVRSACASTFPCSSGQPSGAARVRRVPWQSEEAPLPRGSTRNPKS